MKKIAVISFALHVSCFPAALFRSEQMGELRAEVMCAMIGCRFSLKAIYDYKT